MSRGADDPEAEPVAGPRVSLARFDNSWYDPGRPLPVRAAWLLLGRVFLSTSVPWPSRLKCGLLRLFGARVGRGVVIKPRVRIKYPWRLEVGRDTWIGEGVWLDTLEKVSLGSDVCLSQDAMVETGSHDMGDPAFGLVVRPVEIGDGCWVGARALILPGSRLAPQAVVAAGSTFRGTAEAGGIYRGCPAERRGMRAFDAGS